MIFYECPLTLFTVSTNTIMEAVFLFIHTKYLPFLGGLYEQPHWFVEGLKIYYEEKDLYLESIKKTEIQEK